MFAIFQICLGEQTTFNIRERAGGRKRTLDQCPNWMDGGVDCRVSGGGSQRMVYNHKWKSD
jgi:hypothetical protein